MPEMNFDRDTATQAVELAFGATIWVDTFGNAVLYQPSNRENVALNRQNFFALGEMQVRGNKYVVLKRGDGRTVFLTFEQIKPRWINGPHGPYQLIQLEGYPQVAFGDADPIITISFRASELQPVGDALRPYIEAGRAGMSAARVGVASQAAGELVLFYNNRVLRRKV